MTPRRRRTRAPMSVSLLDILLGSKSGPVRVAGYCAQLPGEGYGLFLSPDAVRPGLEKNGLKLVGDSQLLSSKCPGHVEVIATAVRYSSGDTWGGGLDEIKSIEALTPDAPPPSDEALAPDQARASDEAPPSDEPSSPTP